MKRRAVRANNAKAKQRPTKHKKKK